MADVKKIATRESYGNTLKELAAEGHDDLVVLDADLAAATKTGMFRKAYPDRHFDCGIAEGNMMGVAAGLSTMGYVPFVSSFAMFAAGRAFEQVRNSIGYPHLNVKIGATHGGISVGEDGASHQCCEDFALMRSIPGMTVICPADDVEARAAVRAAYAMEGPVYLRFGRLAVPVFHDAENYHFEIGKGEQITEGSDIAIIATGLMVNEARLAAEQLAADIAAGGSYVCEVDGRVVATFAFLPGPDECYDVIEDGQWRSDTPYAVLHRVASDGTAHGIAAAMFAFAKERADHLRIDTHQDNLPMQGASIKAGFERAGVVHVSDGTPRVAFDWLREA